MAGRATLPQTAAGQTILVTGGAGYVGSHACKALAAAGYRPVVYDNLVAGHREAVKWGPFEAGDIGDRRRLDEVLALHRPAAVMHFAGHSSVAESVADPGRYYRSIVVGTLSLLEAVRDHAIAGFVFSSSAAVYGSLPSSPIAEHTAAAPASPYGAAKWMAEQLLSDFGAAHGLRWMALRYFNAAGADPDGEVGEDHDPETHLVPLVLDAASGARDAITVFGTDYDTPDGTCVRDYVHVGDLADAHVKAVELLASGIEPTACNLGSGSGYSVREIIAAVERVTGNKVPVTIGPRRAGDPASLVADVSKARALLGWNPRLSDLDTIVATAWKWHQRLRAVRGQPARER